MPRKKRSIAEKKTRREKAIKSRAKELRRVIPKAKGIDLRKKLTPHQKGWITRWSKQVGNLDSVHKLTKRQYESLKRNNQEDVLISPSIHAIKLRQTTPDAKVRIDHGAVIVRQRADIWNINHKP